MPAALLLPADYLRRVRDRGLGLGELPQDAQAVPLTSVESDVWQGFLRTSADQIEIGNGEALAWYNVMRTQLDVLDMPLLQQASAAAGVPVSWTKDLDQKLLDLSTMADHCVAWLRQAADGDRKLVVQGDSWGIASAAGDPFHIILDETVSPPQLGMMAGDDHELHQGPQGLGVAPLVVGGIAIPWVIVGVGMVGVYAVAGFVIYLLYTALTAIREIMTGIVQYWTQRTWAQCVQNAKDPADCHKAIAGLTGLQDAVNAGKPAGAGDDLAKGAKAFGDIATALLYVTLAGGVVYLAVTYGPEVAEAIKATLDKHAKAPAAA